MKKIERFECFFKSVKTKNVLKLSKPIPPNPLQGSQLKLKIVSPTISRPEQGFFMGILFQADFAKSFYRVFEINTHRV